MVVKSQELSWGAVYEAWNSWAGVFWRTPDVLLPAAKARSHPRMVGLVPVGLWKGNGPGSFAE